MFVRTRFYHSLCFFDVMLQGAPPYPPLWPLFVIDNFAMLRSFECSIERLVSLLSVIDWSLWPFVLLIDFLLAQQFNFVLIIRMCNGFLSLRSTWHRLQGRRRGPVSRFFASILFHLFVLGFFNRLLTCSDNHYESWSTRQDGQRSHNDEILTASSMFFALKAVKLFSALILFSIPVS